VERKLILTTELAQYMIRTYTGVVGFRDLVKELHDGFGGEFWIGDKLYWASGTEVKVLGLDEGRVG